MLSEWKKDAARFDALTDSIVEVISERDSLQYAGASYAVGGEIVVTSDNNSREMHCTIQSINSREGERFFSPPFIVSLNSSLI